jgi:hypothetical protein
MPQIVDILKDPYGLHGGSILSGSVTTKADAFWYYPITQSVANVKFGGGLSGSLGQITFMQGIGVYGPITEVTQSSGIAILYSGSYLPSY